LQNFIERKGKKDKEKSLQEKKPWAQPGGTDTLMSLFKPNV
jgi:hypothetical protein